MNPCARSPILESLQTRLPIKQSSTTVTYAAKSTSSSQKDTFTVKPGGHGVLECYGISNVSLLEVSGTKSMLRDRTTGCLSKPFDGGQPNWASGRRFLLIC